MPLLARGKGVQTIKFHRRNSSRRRSVGVAIFGMDGTLVIHAGRHHTNIEGSTSRPTSENAASSCRGGSTMYQRYTSRRNRVISILPIRPKAQKAVAMVVISVTFGTRFSLGKGQPFGMLKRQRLHFPT